MKIKFKFYLALRRRRAALYGEPPAGEKVPYKFAISKLIFLFIATGLLSVANLMLAGRVSVLELDFSVEFELGSRFI